MDSIGEVLLTLVGFGGALAIGILILLANDVHQGLTDWKTIRKNTVHGWKMTMEAIVLLVGGLFNFLVGVVLFLLVLYAAIWIIKRMWEAA